MELHKVAHRLFLFAMFVVCCTAVILFARNRVEASLAADTASNTRTVSEPISYVDKTVDKAVTVNSTTTAPTTTTASTSTPTLAPAPTQTVTLDTSISAATDLTELMLSGNSGPSSSDVKQPTQNIENVQTTQDATVKTTATSATETVKSGTTTPVSSRLVEVSVEPVNKLPSQPVYASPEKSDSANVKEIIKEEGAIKRDVKRITEPVVIKAADLAIEKNPKISGKTQQELSVKSVELVKKYDGQSSLLLQGKALPNSFVSVYVFSEDPIVMTVLADADGNWSYELSKDIADGEHEVYVAVTEEDGSVVSKAEPIAFVKTAQAATMIPFSELSRNEAPMQRSTASYVLIAIVIMSICLVIALALIGILTHKYNTDESII
ncbi:MAG: hypothetical protein ACD_14C00010G0004 [uncultured bacterium]|nr:MAG: hypothetical protein ACD_14C00010G0004 [uncultured bacterium]